MVKLGLVLLDLPWSLPGSAKKCFACFACFDRPAGLTLLQLLCKLRGSQFLQSNRITSMEMGTDHDTVIRALLRNSRAHREWVDPRQWSPQFVVYEIGIGYTSRNGIIYIRYNHIPCSHQTTAETMGKCRGIIHLEPFHLNGGWD